MSSTPSPKMIPVGSGPLDMTKRDWKSWANYTFIFVVAAALPEIIALFPFVQERWPAFADAIPLLTVVLASAGVMLKKWLTDNSNLYIKPPTV